MPYLLLAAIAAVPLLLLAWLRERRWNRREYAIRTLLDCADALEAQLQDCRRRMQQLRGMLTILPEEMSADADAALSADAKVQAALKDLLAHRLWIKQHAGDASLREFDTARNALNQSGATLHALIERLAAITTDLERAQSSAQTLSPRGKAP